MANIRVGTASWTDPSLVKSGLFYPKEVKTPEERLRYYASQFNFVEVDSSYYAMPSVANSTKWAERTPQDFLFNVKAFRLFTQHQTEPKCLPPDIRAALSPTTKPRLYYRDVPAELRDELWRRFIEAVEPLARAGKLGALHFQFPKWFIAKSESYDHLMEIRERLRDFTLAIEFREKSWFSERNHEATLEFERQHGFVNVVVDEPQDVPGSIPSVWEATSPQLAIVRLHGRNHETWNAKGLAASSDRFNYDYTQEELEGFAPPIKSLAERVFELLVVLNNNNEDQGVRNGRALRKILGAESKL